MVQLLIIADDFTGSLDTGVQYTALGLKTKVIVNNDRIFDQINSDLEVLVIDTETRHISAKDAYQRIYSITKKAIASGIPHLFKKTDSALRGNIGAELAAFLDASGDEILPFIPAYPKIGRTTENGIHLINGTEVSKSVFGSDPFEPVIESDIQKLIHLQSQIPVVKLAPTASMDYSSSPVIMVFDCTSDSHLMTIKDQLLDHGLTHIAAGCAGFASITSELFHLKEKTPPKAPKLSDRFLVICGSVNPITKAQLAKAQAAGFRRISLTSQQKFDAKYWDSAEGQESLKELQEDLRVNQNIIIDANSPETEGQLVIPPQTQNVQSDYQRVAVSRSIGRILSEIFDSPNVGTILITGGDTLFQCMQLMRVDELDPLLEISPGIVLSCFHYKLVDKYILTKSGGFGDSDLLIQIAEKLKSKQKTE